MNKRQQLALKTHQQTLVLLTQNNLRTGPLEVLALELEECVSKLRELNASQKFHAGERNLHVMRVERLRRVLRLHMLQIKRHAPKLLKGLAGVEAARHVPHATAKTAVLIAHAEAMIRAVQPHKSEYVRAKFATDFLQKFRADVRRLALSVKAIPREAKLLAEATAAVTLVVQQAREIERAMDGTMATRIDAGDKRALAWQNARRMGKVRGRPRKKKKKQQQQEGPETKS
jgi:hypothetical protein